MKIKTKINKINMLVASVLAAVVVLTASAAPFTVSYSGTQKSSTVVTNQGFLNTVQIYNPSLGAATVYLYDSPSSNTTFSLGAYTNYVLSTRQVTNIYTDFNGNSVTNIYTGLTNTTQNVAASTPSYRTVNVLNVPASSTVVSTIGGYLAKGLYSTNTSLTASNLVITVDISK